MTAGELKALLRDVPDDAIVGCMDSWGTEVEFNRAKYEPPDMTIPRYPLNMPHHVPGWFNFDVPCLGDSTEDE